VKDDAVVYAPLELILITIALSFLGGLAGYLSRVDKKQAAKSLFTLTTYLVISETVGLLAMYIALWREEIPDAGIPVYVLACSLSGKDLITGVQRLVMRQFARVESKDGKDG